jgi:TRAP-type C4-dicarboxylate transport system permease large subunit
MVQAMNSSPSSLPLFILMGNILGAARITDRIVASPAGGCAAAMPMPHPGA